MLNSSVSETPTEVNDGEIPEWAKVISHLIDAEDDEQEIDFGDVLSAVYQGAYHEGYLNGATAIWKTMFRVIVDTTKDLNPKMSRKKLYGLYAKACMKLAEEAQD